MKITILYLANKSKTNSAGKCPIRCRITFLKKRKEFSTGLFIDPAQWNSKKQKLIENTEESALIQKQLSLISNKINQAFLMLQIQEESFIVDDIYSLYKGESLQKNKGVIEFYETYLSKLKTLVGIDIKQVTFNKFYYIKNDIKAFIKWKYNSSDLQLLKLNNQFLFEFEYYYKTTRKLKQITINKKIQRFKKVVRVAVAESYIDKDPFLLYKAKPVKKEIIYLSTEELKQLEEYKFKQQRLEFVKNLFVFCCYTGLPYIDLMNLKHQHIMDGFDDNKWISLKRVKTSKDLSIPLLPKALAIISVYNEVEYVFPRISNQKYNSYLKEIAEIVGIEKNLTTHIARKTFATTVLLYNDVPMEIVSELLGHSNMTITQSHYGKIVQKNISKEIEILKNKLRQ